MFFDSSLYLSRSFLAAFGTQMTIHYRSRIPDRGAVLLVSNHRSFMDAPLLMAALNRPVRFACHHYMSKVPALNELVTALGCFSIGAPEDRGQAFFNQAIQFLQDRQVVGIFPEGAQPMIQPPHPQKMTSFQRGFAHLAFKIPKIPLTILPVAIAATHEVQLPMAPLQLFSWFDPSEPLFAQPGWHPAVIYQEAHLLIGRPIEITEEQRSHYHGRQAARLAKELSQTCYNEISHLLWQGF